MHERPVIEAEFDAADAASYAYWHEITLRFNDLDPLGHVTSLSFLSLLETARVSFVHDAGYPVEGTEIGWMLVSLNIDYLAQLHFPGTVRAGTRLKRVGRSSITTLQGLFSNGTCCATLTSTAVLVDRRTDTSVTLPDALREALLALSDTGSLPAG
jgi:acyl-CoA thioester hydrolase